MTVNYKLEYPIQVGSESVSEIELSRPKIKHLKKLDSIVGEIAKICKMIELCSGLLPPIVDEIDVKDIVELGKILDSFQ
jgi:hypothetical protein